MKLHSLVSALALAISLPSAHAAPDPAPKLKEGRTAVQLWNDLVESSLLGVEVEATVAGTSGKVTFGAEKEGSSALITRVMGPSASSYRHYVTRILSDEERPRFLREFLSGWASGRYRESGVHDLSGALKDFNVAGLTQTEVASASSEKLAELFDAWLAQAGDKSFSFIKKRSRQRIFNGDLIAGGVTPMGKAQGWMTWQPLYGLPEKYIAGCSKMFEMGGWEINFAPQPTYANFEQLITWFRNELKNVGDLFEAPGHQRLVFPKWQDLSGPELKDLEARLAEMYKAIQAYIVIRGASGLSGMEKSLHIDKQVHSDSTLATLDAWKGVIRVENERFGEGTRSVEIRAGTKTDFTRRFVEQVITARYATQDFSGLSKVGDWTLVDPVALGALSRGETQALVDRFGVTPEQAAGAITKLKSAKIEKFRNYDRVIDKEYWIPFWNWELAPFVGAEKAAKLKELTRAFIRSLATWENPKYEDFQLAFQTWARSSDLVSDLENYLRPSLPAVSPGELAGLLTFRPPTPAMVIDVNDIDLGIEYTARFPVKLQAAYSGSKLADGKEGWLATQYDLSGSERRQAIEKLALTLAKNLNGGRFTPVVAATDGSHGHSLVIAYQVKDAQGRFWRVEWDGINRTYDDQGVLVPDSGRGGHIEVVTPKFKPSADDVAAVFSAFEENDLTPSAAAGGGHINVDLAPFEGRPRAFARFLSLFIRYRGILALMFQDVSRLKSAEPIPVSQKLALALADFRGSANDLKSALYNERFFNTRVGRKTRYTQLDVSAYFQDVIPSDLLTQDFDLFNDLWRPEFNVDPKIRKAELRIFNAPANAREAALQKNIVRALLHAALNEDDVLDGIVQAVDYEGYGAHPETAIRDFDELVRRFGVSSEDYKPLLLKGLGTARDAIASKDYQPLQQRLAANTELDSVWGKAFWARPKFFAIASEGRIWKGEAEPAAIEFQKMKAKARAQADRLRAQFEEGLGEARDLVPVGLILREHCASELSPSEGRGAETPMEGPASSQDSGSWSAQKAVREWVRESWLRLRSGRVGLALTRLGLR